MPAHEPGSSLFVRLHAPGNAEAVRALPQFDFAVPDALISSTVFSRRAVFSS